MARYSNDMVAHVWAQMTKDSGDSNNGQFYFRGPRLYSYGSHFVAGFIDAKGRAWLNGDSYSPTTSKHMSYAWRAVSHRESYRVPSLTGIVGAIEAATAGDKSRTAWAKRELSAYFDSHWESFDPAGRNGEAGAILWRAVQPRGEWAKEWERRKAKAARNAEKAAKAAKAAGLALAREVAAIPLDMVRLRMIQAATAARDEWARERRLSDAVSYYREAHRGSNPGKIRAAVWERVKLAKELAARLNRNSSAAFAKRRGAIATLRRIWAGDYGAPDALNAALAERQAIREALEAHGPAALRSKAAARLDYLASEIERLEREREAARMAEQEAERLAWLANDPDGPRRAYHLKDERGGALIRATGVELDGCRVIGGTLETSQGATVPLAHAVRAFAFVRAVRERGEAWTRNGSGPRVGHFQIDRVEPSGDFVAGCHRINWNETERLARSLGVWGCPATALEGEAE